jgi:hypothetical protein
MDKNLEEIARVAEQFQLETDRHFGDWEHSFRSALMMLVFNKFGRGDNLAGYSLREVLPAMLRYHDVYCNDEGEHWVDFEPSAEDDDCLELMNWYNCSMEEYSHKAILREQMITFFSMPENNKSKKVRELMATAGVVARIFHECSRRGRSS